MLGRWFNSHSYEEVKPRLEPDHRDRAHNVTLTPTPCLQGPGQSVAPLSETQCTLLHPALTIFHPAPHHPLQTL